MSFLINKKYRLGSLASSVELASIRKDPAKQLGPDPAKVIFSNLNATDVMRCQQVNKKWKVLASQTSLSKTIRLHKTTVIDTYAFGKEKWGKLFGDVGEVPPLPDNIEEILRSPCPYFPDKYVMQTHMLVLIPKTINGLPLTLWKLHSLIMKPKTGKPTYLDYILIEILKEYGDIPIQKSHWVLMTNDVIPGTREKSFSEQEKLVKSNPKYQIPSLLVAATCILMNYFNTGLKLFSRVPSTYTRCRETSDGCYTYVGGFRSGGLSISANKFDDFNELGAAALREL